MSEYGDEIDFEGGFLDEAGINANDIPDDPFGFGNDFHRVFVLEVGAVKVTKNKDKIGMMVKFAVDEAKYQGSFVSKTGLGNGMWVQLPVPLELRSQIPWNSEGEMEQQAMYNLKELYKALGFAKDEYGSVNGKKMTGRPALAKIKVKRGDSGFWEFNLNAMKPIGDGDGASEFTSQGTSNPAKSAAELLEEELKG
jgi:hypothetical protein